MSTSITIASGSSETGALLRTYLYERGIYDKQAKANVAYGLATNRHVSFQLNANCQSNKINRMVAIEKAGGRNIPWYSGSTILTARNLKFPLLARRAYGQGGTDILPVFQAEELPWRIAAGAEWFSEYVSVAAEFRAWVYRDTILDTFEKVMKRPHDYAYIGRNFRNGFDFQLTYEHKEASKQALLATNACELDFAAVDLLLGKDGNIFILETNSAPGVLKSKAQSTLHKLADHIQGWVAAGYPERKK